MNFVVVGITSIMSQKFDRTLQFHDFQSLEKHYTLKHSLFYSY